MEDAGQKLKKRREELDLRYRDVEDASNQIASRRGSDEFSIAISRLADIENKGTVPSIYRIYTLCAIYRLDVLEVLEWYGIDLAQLPGDAASIQIGRTHVISFQPGLAGEVQLPISLDPGVDLRKTTYLSRMIQRWGKMPLMLLNSLDLKQHRYAYVGGDDWSMFPLIHPGSLVMIDETKRKVVNSGWNSEHDRPIYFLESRDGYLIGWCTQNDTHLIVQPHPSTELPAQAFRYPQEIDVVGQITGVAMKLQDQLKKRRMQKG